MMTAVKTDFSDFLLLNSSLDPGASAFPQQAAGIFNLAILPILTSLVTNKIGDGLKRLPTL
jgi:hypothetical protein